ncbi:MAG: TolB family protein, partial [Planctomycetota bacterium]
NEDEYRKVIVRALRKVGKTNLKESAFVECGTVYPPAVREQKRIVHERMPSLAAGPDGRLHLAYVTDEAGSNDVLLRSADVRGRWGEPVTLAATDADEYAPSVAVTKDGGVVVAYAANPKGGRYDIYTVTASGGKVGKPKRVTRSPDDAMAPCLAADADRLWLSWYEWRKMGKLSRDREVFASRSSGRGWSKPLQVSPREVDGYEDHADPVIRPDGNGGAWVAWAWDYHETLPSRPPVKENSIFVRHIDSRMKMGPVLAAGFRGEGTARDYSPAIEVAKDGSPWVIWDNLHKASAGWSAKGVFVNRLAGEDFGEQFEVGANGGAVCSPRLVADPQGGLRAIWSRWTSAGWELRMRRVDAGGPGDADRIEVAGKEPRYPCAAFDREGRLWVAYSDASGSHWKVQVERVK